MSRSSRVDPGLGLTVLHIGPTPFFSDRGCHIRLRGLIRGLSVAGVDGVLCTYHHGRDIAGIETLRIPAVPGYRRVEAGPAGLKYVADALLFVLALVATWRRRPDVIHGHLHEGALIGWAVARLLFWRRIPLVLDVQGSLTGELAEYGYFERAAWKRRLFEGIERFVDHRADAVACSSASSLEVARDRFEVSADRLFEIPDGVDVEPPEPSRSVESRAELGLAADATVVVYTGALLQVKGLSTLHEVIRIISQRAPNLRFLLIGYPVDATRRFLADHGIERHCVLTGRVPFERLGDFLAAGDIAVEPKASESGEASGKLLNYMAAGLPVAAFSTINNRRMLGDSGCYASPGSVEQLAEAIVALSQAPQRRRDLGARGRARVAANFDWDASARRLVDLYRALLAARSPS